MSPNAISLFIPFVAAAVACLVLVAEHYIPRHKLSQPTSYIIGSLACLVPICVMFSALEALETLTAFTATMTVAVTYVCGGLVVIGCYRRDGRVGGDLQSKAENEAARSKARAAKELQAIAEEEAARYG
jgi:hypothetical protein